MSGSSPLTVRYLVGDAALSSFRLARVLLRLREIEPRLEQLQATHIYVVSSSEPLSSQDTEHLQAILNLPTLAAVPAANGLFVAARAGTLSPWSSKATDIAQNCGLGRIRRIDRVTQWTFEAGAAVRWSTLAALLHDRMTETAHLDLASLSTPHSMTPRPLRRIPLLEHGDSAIAALNLELGLALATDEIEYLARCYRGFARNPTDAELMMFAQANSEHCRHKIFNAEWEIDREPRTDSLFDLVRATHAANPNQVLSAYRDNAAVSRGYRGERWLIDPRTRCYRGVSEEIELVMKVETHNHPTAISPFAGAATGAGGEIRDEGATGRGARPKAGLTGFCVSHLRIPGFEQAWEKPRPLNPRLANPLQIMLDGPLGAAAFNNEFGRPALAGYFRTFEQTVVNGGHNERRGYDKPIMLAGGIGNIRTGHIEKLRLPPGAQVLVLGGPAMLIGLGGGAASSQREGMSDPDLDFASVQRDNAEMERRAQEVIDACWALGPENPILSVHDVGAGGLSNAIPELLHDSVRGGRLNLRAIPSADSSLSPLEIWCNEAQERYVLGVLAERVSEVLSICARERCPSAVIGEVTEEEQLVLWDPHTQEAVIDLPMDVIFGKPPKMKRAALTSGLAVSPIPQVAVEKLAALIRQVLRFPAVGDKRFLITIGDRTVGGLSVRDQMVGPWQVPVADCAVTALSFGSTAGEAFALGERTPLALLNSAASARMAIGEAITNLAAARIMDLRDVVLSANWMTAAGHPGEDAKLFSAVAATSALCIELKICIPVGKDSMSMRSVWQDEAGEHATTSPLSLVVSAFAPVADTEMSLTPVLQRRRDTSLLFIDLARGAQRLGGSVAAQVQDALGTTTPDLDCPQDLAESFAAIQLLNEAGYLLAYHDRSDGGLLVTLLEMAFAGRCGISIDLTPLGGESLGALFCEELGIVVQVETTDVPEVLAQFGKTTGLMSHIHAIGAVNDDTEISIVFQNQTLYQDDLFVALEEWSQTSYRIQSLRDNAICADEELATILDRHDPGLSLHIPESLDVTPPMLSLSRPRIAVLREQGVNGHREMAAAFTKAGFDAIDVHMSDLISGAVTLAAFEGLVACGGFSYGDVLGAGGGWAKSILFNAGAYDQFSAFFARPNTFSLGVCNGCQMLSQLKSIIPGATHWPRFMRNRSEQFEARLVMAEVLKTPSILFADMHGLQAPVVVAHGEGRLESAATQGVCLRYVDNRGRVAAYYPHNPNGSEAGATGVTTQDGRVTILMPHPERVFLRQQFSWLDPTWRQAESPWFGIFRNARRFVH
ncbi:MAG: phosphoribosylformylglycinamidine synthase [Gammaproteobacteria bacterium]|nr:phosphoribosylformylglycinamidine synthase [Gammaproteobacteria bacterium]